jgi:hypothetical protein
MHFRLTKASIKPPTSDPISMKGIASSTMLTKTIAKELRVVDSAPEGRNTRAAARKSTGR